MVATRHYNIWHLGEMFLAMVVGMAALDAVFGGILSLAGTSYRSSRPRGRHAMIAVR